LQISPQQAARDRGFVGQLFRAHNVGRRMVIQRRNFRQQNFQRGPNQRGRELRRGQQNPPQRATGQQFQRGRSAVQPANPQDRRKRGEYDRPGMAPRGGGGRGFRSAPPPRQFNQQRFR
jgi:hypothetical protein